MHEKWTLSLFLITVILIGLTIVYIRYKALELKQLEEKLSQISDKTARYVTYTDVMDVVQHSDQYRRLVDQQSQLSNHIGTLYQHNTTNATTKIPTTQQPAQPFTVDSAEKEEKQEKQEKQNQEPQAKRTTPTSTALRNRPNASSDTDDVHSDGSFDFAAAVER